MVDLSHLDPVAGAVWDALLDLAALRPTGWTLVGAQMVVLCGHERGRQLARATADADVLVDVRVARGGTAGLAQLLVNNGFELEGVDAFGVGHRFGNGRTWIDVLAPDGLAGARSRLTTTIPPARTVAVPGGTQALHRSRPVEIQRGERRGQVPCPDLLGAILVKARAVEVDESQRHSCPTWPSCWRWSRIPGNLRGASRERSAAGSEGERSHWIGLTRHGVPSQRAKRTTATSR